MVLLESNRPHWPAALSLPRPTRSCAGCRPYRLDPHPEIEEAVAIRSPDPMAHNYPEFTPPILEWLFSRDVR